MWARHWARTGTPAGEAVRDHNSWCAPIHPIPHLVSSTVDIKQELAQLKKRRRSVKPDDMHALLSEAGFDRRYGKGDHWVYTHPRMQYPLTIDPENPLLPAYVSKAIRVIEEVLADEENR